MKHLSISSLNLHKKNPRRWCLEYLEGIRSPPTVHTEFGTKLHTAVEQSIKGNEYDLGRNTLSIAKWREQNSEWIDQYNWRLEDDFKIWLRPDLPPIRGVIDMWTYCPEEMKVMVLDHKTATKGYEETEISIQKNWQLALYAYAVGSHTHNSCIIGHNQFFKTRDFFIYDTKTIRHNIGPDDIIDIKNEIELEMEKALTTELLYKRGGLKEVLETPENQKWYGRPCDYWDCIVGAETVEDLRKRIVRSI